MSTRNTASVSTINIKVQGVEGIEFSADGENWGSSIDADDIIEAGGLIPYKFYPVSTSAVSNSSGLLNFYDVSYTTTGSRVTMTSSYTSISPIESNGVLTGWDSTDEGLYICFDLYIHAEHAQTVILNAGTSVISDVDTGAQLAVRVAFLNLGTIAESEYNSSNPTDLTSLIGEDIQAVIFEPNAQWHASDAITMGYSSENGIIDPYYAISGIGEGIPATPLTQEEKANIESISCLQLIDSITYAGASVYQSSIYSDVLLEPDTEHTIASVDGGYSKLRIYMWLEGQDGDCVNQISGSYVTFNIKLTTKELVENN